MNFIVYTEKITGDFFSLGTVSHGVLHSYLQGLLLRTSLTLAFRDAPELRPGLSPEVLSSQGIFLRTSVAQSCKLQFQQTKRTSPYSSNMRSCVASEQLALAAVPRPAS